MQINRDRLISDLETLASFSDGTPPGISRLVFAEADQQARVGSNHNAAKPGWPCAKTP